MDSNNTIERVAILIQQKKFSEAEKSLKNLLTQDSENIQLLFFLGEVYLEQDKFKEAQDVANLAIGLDPEVPVLHYLKSRVEIGLGQLNDAEKSIIQAISMDPEDADFFAMLANIKMARKKFEDALDSASLALEIDPQNVLALNLRSAALNKLGRSEESASTIENALMEDPNNAYTHANVGWVNLEQGRHQKAMEHFQESLKIDPNSDYAKSGMIEAIKSTNFAYRLFLKYSFWRGNLSSRLQWAFFIGIFVLGRSLNAANRHAEEFSILFVPLMVLLALFTFSTWLMTPISDLFIRFHKYGKHLLSGEDRISSNFVALSIAIALIGLALVFILDDSRFSLLTAFGFLMVPLLSSMFHSKRYRLIFLGANIVIGLIGVYSLFTVFLTSTPSIAGFVLFVIGVVAFQWVSNYLLIKEENL